VFLLTFLADGLIGADYIELSDPTNKLRHKDHYTTPISAHKCEESDGSKKRWEGVTVETLGDFNDHKGGRWSAKFPEGYDRNVFLITQPYLPACATGKKSKSQHDLDAEESVIEGREMAMTQYRRRLAANDDAKLYKLLVILPQSMRLSNKPFQGDGFAGDPDVDIDYVLTHVRSQTGWKEHVNVGEGGKKAVDVYTFSSWIKWHFVDLNSEQFIRPPRKTKGGGDKVGECAKFDNSMEQDESDGEH